MPMPKTSVDEHSLPPSTEDDVRGTRQVLGMQMISITQSKEKTTNLEFWSGIYTSNPGHDLTSR
jgi:hypothetical protein